MKRILTVVLAMLILSVGLNASAFIAELKVSFDVQGDTWWVDCPTTLTLDTLTVWTSDLGMYTSAIEYKIEYDPVVTFIKDLMIGDALPIGSSDTGITIAYPSPGDAWDPFPVQRVVVMWNSTDCEAHRDSPITIVPHPDTGKIQIVRWPDLYIMEAQGGTSYICPTLTPTQATTWGAVKTLYE
jgi:hypothetical protein